MDEGMILGNLAVDSKGKLPTKTTLSMNGSKKEDLSMSEYIREEARP
jgi:hypothetical protein